MIDTSLTLWIGSIFYIVSLIGFILLLLVHAARFLVRPSLLPESLSHPSEGLYVPTFPTALGVLILNGATYSRKMHMMHGPSLRGAFWLYAVVSLLFSVASPLAE
jgi:tellurite resistance protein TehA-like permease